MPSRQAATDTAEAERLKASGNALLSAGDHPGAIEAYTSALALLPPPSPTIGKGTNESSPQSTPLRSVLLSNRSRTLLEAGRPVEALSDAEACADESPGWPKAHFCRAGALKVLSSSICGGDDRDRRRDALDAYDDALAAATEEKGCKRSESHRRIVKEIKSARRKLAAELRVTGSSALSPEVAETGCVLAVPEDGAVEECFVLAAKLDPASYDAVDERNGTPIHAEFPGDPAWPVVVASFSEASGGRTGTTMRLRPLCLYVVGPCTLTGGCADEIDDIFRPNPRHACRWPDGLATRTCPFCAGACVPGRGETFTMVLHMLFGKARNTPANNVNIGIKLMMQLVCGRCTRKYLRRAKRPDKADDKCHELELMVNGAGNEGNGAQALAHLRMLTEGSHAIRASQLWNRASNVGLTSSITLHANGRITRLMNVGGVMHNTGGKNTAMRAPHGDEDGCFFDRWMAGLDERAIYKSTDGPRKVSSPGPTAQPAAHTSKLLQLPESDRGRAMGQQAFFIRQIARITDLQRAIGRFWDKHGAAFRLCWSRWTDEERREFAHDCGSHFVESRVEHFNRRHTLYHLIEDPRPLINRPLGSVPRRKACFLPELTEAADVGGGDLNDQRGLLQMFQDRTTVGKSWVSEDVSLVADLKKKGLLPKLGINDRAGGTGGYLCDYMGLEDPSIGPFVVPIGEKEAKYDATGDNLSSASPQTFMSPEQIIRTGEYRSLREPFAENVTIFNAVADGEVRDSLNGLLTGGAATCAVCYIYALQRQTLLLEYLHSAAMHFCILFVEGFDPNEAKRWSHYVTAACYVCAARTRLDGSKLLCCSRCQNVFYCSPECQKKDWKRHKAESCTSSPNYVGSTLEDIVKSIDDDRCSKAKDTAGAKTSKGKGKKKKKKRK